MPSVPFSYFPIDLPPSAPHPDGQTVYRPLAVATLTATNGNSLRFVVLADTGADACMFPLAVALALDLDVLSLPRAMTGGVGSTSNITYYDTITVDLGSGVSSSVYAGFTEGMNAHGIGLLGQSGFFSSFDVTFSHAAKVFTVLVP